MKRGLFRKNIVCIVLLPVMLLTGCSGLIKSGLRITKILIAGDVEIDTEEQEAAKEHMKELIECFRNKNKMWIQGFLCLDIVKKHEDIGEQMDRAFALFDGPIVFVDEEMEAEGEGLGMKTDVEYSAKTHVKTDQGTEYTIEFCGWYTNLNIEYTGARYIKVVNETEISKLPSDSPERESYMALIGEY